jgi:hypothetical protein
MKPLAVDFSQKVGREWLFFEFLAKFSWMVTDKCLTLHSQYDILR